MFLLFDIGGTNTKLATSVDGETIQDTRILKTERDFENEIELITAISKELIGDNNLEAAAGGIAGSLNNDKSALIKSPHLQQWVERPIKNELETNFDAPVFLQNDAHLGGLGEANFGAGKDYSVIAFITIGTGIGGVRIVDKNIDRNSLGFEPGHQVINIDGDACSCGGFGHLESYVAGAYLKNLYGANAEHIKDEKIWSEIAKYLSVGLNNTIVHWSPDIVILGGSVSQKIPIDAINSDLNKNLRIFPAPEVIRGTLNQEATLYGALKLVTEASSEDLE